MSAQTPAYNDQLAHLHEDKGPRTIAASGVLIALTTLAVVLRLLAQRIVKPSFTTDDYCAFAALARFSLEECVRFMLILVLNRSLPLRSALT